MLQVIFSAILRATFSAPDAYYGTFGYGVFGGSVIGYPLAYSHGYAAANVPATYNYAAQVNYGYAATASSAPVHTIAAPVITKAAHLTAAPVITQAAPLIAAPVIAEAAPAITKVHSELHAKVPSVTSSQFQKYKYILHINYFFLIFN